MVERHPGLVLHPTAHPLLVGLHRTPVNYSKGKYDEAAGGGDDDPADGVVAGSGKGLMSTMPAYVSSCRLLLLFHLSESRFLLPLVSLLSA